MSMNAAKSGLVLTNGEVVQATWTEQEAVSALAQALWLTAPRGPGLVISVPQPGTWTNERDVGWRHINAMQVIEVVTL